MFSAPLRTFNKNEASARSYPNYWDFLALILVVAVIVALGWGAHQMTDKFELGETISISLNPEHLPYYALRSVLRLLIALVFSLLATFIFGTLAAKSKTAERIIIPLIDILQSVPVLSFLSITVFGFIALFRGSMFGPECAAIFAVFTSQVWNMILSFYQSLKVIPKEMREAVDMFHLSSWQRFWKVEAPFAMPGLLWNMMMSMSASWFFVVAAEAISVAHQDVTLPGIGSYINLALHQMDILAIIYAIAAMLMVILLYDQLMFRPLTHWAERFRCDEDLEDERGARSWVVKLFKRTRLLRQLDAAIEWFWDIFVNTSLFRRKHHRVIAKPGYTYQRILTWLWNGIFGAVVIVALAVLIRFLYQSVTISEIKTVFYLGFITGFKVMVLILISSLIWVPIGVWIGMRPRVTRIIQPIVQILAAFPANLFFPIVVFAIVTYHLDANIWTAPLMVLGTQWYILFNVIAGAGLLPKELRQAASNFGVTGWLWWKRLVLPGIFPYFITGAITAAGGAWNASIIAEAVSWGSTQIDAVGLGAYITYFSEMGNFANVVLGTVAMSIYVLAINHILWRPLYRMSQTRFQIG